jgi:hypothetical protein
MKINQMNVMVINKPHAYKPMRFNRITVSLLLIKVLNSMIQMLKNKKNV